VREPFILVLPKAHVGPAHSLKVLSTTSDFVSYSLDTVIGAAIEAQLHRWGIDPPLRLQLDNSHAVLSMVMSGVGWTITTPLCLLQAGVLDGEAQCLRIPEGEFHRELTLVARADGLGTLPEQLAEDTVQVLRTRYLPILQARAPWLANLIQLGDHAQDR
jgi:DNA-binding transcriptional LysR family regulator